MNDRDALLRTILRQPREDTARLVYADWLEENPATDEKRLAIDRATVEFIRASCAVGRRGNQMPKTAYDWLHDNWTRLIPSVVALHNVEGERGMADTYLRPAFDKNRWRETSGLVWGRDGRRIFFNAVTLFNGSPREFGCEVRFWKGFSISWKSYGVRGILREPFKKDQDFHRLADRTHIGT